MIYNAMAVGKIKASTEVSPPIDGKQFENIYSSPDILLVAFREPGVAERWGVELSQYDEVHVCEPSSFLRVRLATTSLTLLAETATDMVSPIRTTGPNHLATYNA